MNVAPLPHWIQQEIEVAEERINDILVAYGFSGLHAKFDITPIELERP